MLEQSERGSFLPSHIVLVGCGQMGGALLRGWLAADLDTSFGIVNPSPLAKDLLESPRIDHLQNDDQKRRGLQKAEIIVLAVKPQIIYTVLSEIAASITPGTLILSVIAGKTLEDLEQSLPAGQPVIRTMPNTPAAIGKGVTAAIANPAVTTVQKQNAGILMRCSGDVIWLDTEDQMDSVTAISGCGPAYVFYFIEALTEAGTKLGLDAAQAEALARQTVIGSAALAESDHQKTASTLRENVTSPGGVTEQALSVLMRGEWQDILAEATHTAFRKSRDFGD